MSPFTCKADGDTVYDPEQHAVFCEPCRKFYFEQGGHLASKHPVKVLLHGLATHVECDHVEIRQDASLQPVFTLEQARKVAEVWDREAEESRKHRWLQHRRAFVFESYNALKEFEELPDALGFYRLGAACPSVEAGLDGPWVWYRIFDLDAIVREMQALGVENPFVANTGGGCATIYAGPTRMDPCPFCQHATPHNDEVCYCEMDGCDCDRTAVPGWWGERYALVAGPGSFRSDGTAYADEDFNYARDEEEQSERRYVAKDLPEKAIAEEMAAFLKEYL